jgi:hypothetical protein
VTLLRGRYSVRREFDYRKSKTEVSSRDESDAVDDAVDEIIAAQREGPAATQRCLEKYHNTRFYTREDQIYSYYKFDGNNIWNKGKFM